jgi:hypothetical protein
LRIPVPGGIQGAFAVRKFVVLSLLALALVAQPAEAATWPRWVRPVGQGQVVIQFERTKVSTAMWAELTAAMQAWSRSGRVEAVPVARCTDRYRYCVRVTEYRARDGKGGRTLLYADPRTNRAWYGEVRVNLYYANTKATRRKIACHELGHAVGAVHRAGNTCMHDGLTSLFGSPNGADYALLQSLYRTAGS